MGKSSPTHTHAFATAWSLTTEKERPQVSLIAIEWSNHFWCSSYLIVWELCCALDWILYWKFKHFYLSSWTKIFTFEPKQGDVAMHRKKPEMKMKEKKTCDINKEKIKQNIIINLHCMGRDRQARADICLNRCSRDECKFRLFPMEIYDAQTQLNGDRKDEWKTSELTVPCKRTWNMVNVCRQFVQVHISSLFQRCASE